MIADLPDLVVAASPIVGGDAVKGAAANTIMRDRAGRERLAREILTK